MKPGDVLHGYRLVKRLDQGGSDRKFFRCKKGNNTYVMVYDNDLEQYLTLHKHFLEKRVAVPKVYWHNLDQRLVVQEDLGDTSLFVISKTKSNTVSLYERAIDELIRLQVDARPGVPLQCYYDQEHIRWEQEYFRNHFLVQYCGFQGKDLHGLEDDLTTIMNYHLETAEPISDYLMHRDFQSQNIYFKHDKIRIIDFQSARIGPLTYDLAALLRDAYVDTSAETENLLIEYYLSRIYKRGITIPRHEFHSIYELSSLQRNMQALGAFANLSLNKGKPHFAQYIPRGVALLKRGLEGKDFAKLHAVVSMIES